MTKTIIASLIAVGFATSAFASDASEVLHQNVNQPVVAQQTQQLRGTQAYAYAPAHNNASYTSAEQRAFDRATEAALSQ
ncbi:hypothetical protein [Undibacter mobilis]|uniref:DUF4148 domain-containing protein n=1 Tax=Undibacter mobilis TaxID=2292256 RepID=A0A371B6V9_9BRAD|nr:hypothetical protein [Undibacter mobilis]RDV03329.1 hypothetical protein DXH78_01225 [Undibacter mobilis]